MSIIIPTYNESKAIVNTLNEIITHLNTFLKEDYEIIVIDDHSGDDTFNIIEQFPNQRIRCMRLSRNSGSHIAIRAGLRFSRGDAVACISADGQDDPNIIRAMMEEWRKGYKIVWALKRNRKNDNLFIRITAQLYYKLLLWLVEARDITVDVSRANFFLLDRMVVEAINSCPERHTSVFGLVAWLGFSQSRVEYERRLRKSGHSKWSLRNKFRLAKDSIIAFSGLPLKLASLLGLAMSMAGILYALYIIIKALTVTGWPPVQGWASTIVMILIFGGIQMIILGIIGEYVWSNLDESRRRPLYFIERSSREKSYMRE